MISIVVRALGSGGSSISSSSSSSSSPPSLSSSNFLYLFKWLLAVSVFDLFYRSNSGIIVPVVFITATSFSTNY